MRSKIGFNKANIEKAFWHHRRDALKDGFTEEQIEFTDLHVISRVTKSARILRLIRWAFHLGTLNGIRRADEAFNVVTLRDGIYDATGEPRTEEETV